MKKKITKTPLVSPIVTNDKRIIRIATSFLIVGTFVLGLGLLGAFSNGSKSNDGIISPQIPERTPENAQVQKKRLVELNIDWNRVVNLSGQIDSYSVDSAIKQINSIPPSSTPLFLLISSPGGSVFDGERLISTMESYRGPIYTICVDLCASMAAIIHQYGTARFSYDRAVLMFHDAAGGFQGDLRKMRTRLSFVARVIEKMDRYIANKSHISYEKFMDMHKDELWIDAEDALKAGLVEGIAASHSDPNAQVLPSQNDPEQSNIFEDSGIEVWQ